MSDRHVRRDGDDYAGALASLLPTGQAWPRSPESVLQRTIKGLARYWGYVDGRIADLLERETDPRKTFDMLPDWERNFGLPDACFVQARTIEERRNVLLLKMTILGGQSRAFFYYVARLLGYQIRIREHAPFMAGISRCGTTWDDEQGPRWEIGPPEMRFYWSISVGNIRLSWFRASVGQAGIDHHLSIALVGELYCAFKKWKPAHTEIVFDYSGLETPDPMAGTP